MRESIKENGPLRSVYYANPKLFVSSRRFVMDHEQIKTLEMKALNSSTRELNICRLTSRSSSPREGRAIRMINFMAGKNRHHITICEFPLCELATKRRRRVFEDSLETKCGFVINALHMLNLFFNFLFHLTHNSCEKKKFGVERDCLRNLQREKFLKQFSDRFSTSAIAFRLFSVFEWENVNRKQQNYF